MNDQRITAEYVVETPLPLAEAAEALAGEQSTGTFTRVPGETDELRARFSARLESVESLGTVAAPSLPGAAASVHPGGAFVQGRVRISFPAENTGANLPTLVATVAGNLFELRQFSGLRLMDLDVPPSLAAEFPRPQFGVAGTRRLAGVFDRPLIGTIIKPSVGLSPVETADLVRTLALAGIDFVKDDELMANPPHSPLASRVHAVMRAVHDAADVTGRQAMVAFNISDSIDRMRANHDLVASAGGTCVVVSLNS
ncbi:MAG TPA: RuBisCO large subunit C-terminal-like domain-containing protein, partial [Lacipirellulaceae bacterium]|nr:RuBisCO large subunit C-terminal-like domain-containing protein [Lacipirellulaceae bacterium]